MPYIQHIAMVLLYNLGIQLYRLLIWVVAPFHPKARLWKNGRRDLIKRIAEAVPPDQKTVWIHCSSLGEFEQGRPVMEYLRSRFPQYKIVLTFFSPSGYEIRKNYSGADYIFYLPIDTRANAGAFIRAIHPTLAVFVKYEFWYHYLTRLHASGIPIFLISANFRPNQVFFKSYGGWYRKFLSCFSRFFVQNERSAQLLAAIGLDNVTVTGDTRFDRVARIASEVVELPLLDAFTRDADLIVAGSTWPKDESLLFEVMEKLPRNTKLVVAPHEIDANHIRAIISSSPYPAICYSKATAHEAARARIMVIDTMGMLAAVYRYGIIAYIGGGFGAGIHNILEAATYGMPVIFGPNHTKFQEANDLISLGAAFPVKTPDDLLNVLNHLLLDKKNTATLGGKAKEFVHSGVGATEKIWKYLSEYL